MNLVTKRDLIRYAPELYAKRYCRHLTKRERENARPDAADINEALLARLQSLDLETCTEADVITCVADLGLTSLVCYECDTPVDSLVEIGERDDPANDHTALRAAVCLPCLQKAVELARTAPRLV